MLTIKHQRIILEQLETNADVDIEHQTFLNRWIIRGTIKGKLIKYLLSNYSSSSSSPNLVLTQSTPASIPGAPMTPPSSPHPTPPSFISLSPSATSSSTTKKEQQWRGMTASLEELFHKSNLLNDWISENYDGDKTSK
ncbi:hypothetical protein DICPUDRAFT_77096 [Dictyostelium purpureum]|uniref:Uncharacterized protein n=1 Tax=Dictyostelium purpureum TaxID=5786 RepID=F0ZFK8_DICPU|nr:uncharacterized protein DICPUDRAFT_77096 [Dictyostelium purpureum]EGC37295.1 hypothetical protein DICPUDRAFT_77096 [Dictyostelium purpureum]|eukprot:XP_003286183.1 hypothetical protein DICPUDRAFT_77096 [Dictyostelium purpureum]